MFKVAENKLNFKQVDHTQVDGVTLTDDEREYLLPHFLMLLVGKPGSGKTTLLKQLITNGQMYFRKFDDVLLVSPSHAKMGLKVKKDNTTASFSLDWIFNKINTINEEQLEHVFGSRQNRTINGKKQIKGNDSLANHVVLNDHKSRFLLSDAFTQARKMEDPKKPDGKKQQQEHKPDDGLQKKYEELKAMSREKQEKTHRNVLLVLDDVVGSIKKAEYDPRLAQLVMNRRHLIFNGTISIIVVTQKYTLVPARIRSNASWIILFQVNPMDFELAYRDAVLLTKQKWRDLVQFVFGIKLHEDKNEKHVQKQEQQEDTIDEDEDKENEPPAKMADHIKSRKFDNLGIWVEHNVYFQNFKKIEI